MPKDLQNSVCEEHVFSSLYQKYAELLAKFLYYKFGNGLPIEDKVQEAFIRLWDNCAKVSVAKAKSFLFTVASNSLLNEIKHKKVQLNYTKLPQKSYTNESPEFILEQEEYLKKYQQALSKLTEGQREVFLMNRVEGKRHKEIADLLNISTKAVEKRLYGALKKMKDILEIKND
ncbi:RNA polymerase sigma factor [Urechidicola sp. KH5]